MPAHIAKKRHPVTLIRGFFLLSHPLPLLLHGLAVTLCALVAGWSLLARSWPLLVLAVAGHMAMQLSIAFVNDYCDRELDAQTQPRKPIPRGLVRPREALLAGSLLALLMVALQLPLPREALVISLLYLLLGQLYNAGLKSTPLSGLLFALAMPLIPLYAFAALGRLSAPLLWLLPAGALLGVALNLANALPDLEADAAHGARTLAVTLGARGAFVVCQLALLLCALLIGLLTALHLVPAQPWFAGGSVVLVGLAALGALILWRHGLPAQQRKMHFYVVAALSLLLAAGWLIGAFAACHCA